MTVDDYSSPVSFANTLGTEVFVRFSPYTCGDSCMVRTDTEIYYKGKLEHMTLFNTGKIGLPVSVPSLDDAKQFLKTTTAGGVCLKRHPILPVLLEKMKEGSIYFQALYGRTVGESSPNLLNMILGTRYAQLHDPKLMQKPLVMALFHPYYPEVETVLRFGSSCFQYGFFDPNPIEKGMVPFASSVAVGVAAQGMVERVLH